MRYLNSEHCSPWSHLLKQGLQGLNMLHFMILQEDGTPPLLPEGIIQCSHHSECIPIFPNLDKQAHVEPQTSHANVQQHTPLKLTVLHCSVIDHLQGAPLQSLNRISTCSPSLPPLAAQPDHTVLVRVSDNYFGFHKHQKLLLVVGKLNFCNIFMERAKKVTF